MSEQNSPKSLFAKMALILKSIERIPKRGRNPHFNYDYVLDADVLESVRNQFAEHGIAFFVSVADFRQETRTSSRGNDTIKTIVGIDATFADAESGESFTVRWIGEADDQQDKGANKALTAGVKYGLIKTFLIPTGEDDADGSAGTQPGSRQPKTTPTKTQKPPAGKPGLYVMTFGKHGPPNAKTVAEVAEKDPKYLKWILDNVKPEDRPDDIKAIRAHLGMTDQKSPTPAGDNVGLLRAQFQELMETVYPDLRGVTAINRALNEKGKPNLQDMTAEQLNAGVDWLKGKLE